MSNVRRRDDIQPEWDEHVGYDMFARLPECVKWLNDKTYEKIPEADELLATQPDLAPIYGNVPSLRQQSHRCEDTIGVITHYNTSTLRSLNLDWVLSLGSEVEQYAHFERLSTLRFPHLRAFQLRNAVTEHTLLGDIYLLQPSIFETPGYTEMAAEWDDDMRWPLPKSEYKIDLLSFMEAHPNLECLAWPMDKFFAAPTSCKEDKTIRDRAQAVVLNLGRTLVNLRVDFWYTARGEPQTDEDGLLYGRDARTRRRMFISDFAAHMTKLKVLKLEGGIPRDEKRELMAATARSPIEKLVMIAVSCPLGNTWGTNGEDISAIDEGNLQFHGLLEAEPEEGLIENTKEHFFPGKHRRDGPFQAQYGWPAGGPSLLHSIALHHASTITELKFCGYNGSPVLHKATPITSALLHHLKHFHNLKKIVLSFWLLTFFDFDWREAEIIDYWLDQRSPTSTALIPAPLPALPPTPPFIPAPPPMQAPSWANLVAANTAASVTDGSFTTALSNNGTSVDDDGDTTMGVYGANDHAPAPYVSSLAALNGNPDYAVLNPDMMMAAALGSGMFGHTSEEATVLPIPPEWSEQPSPFPDIPPGWGESGTPSSMEEEPATAEDTYTSDDSEATHASLIQAAYAAQMNPTDTHLIDHASQSANPPIINATILPTSDGDDRTDAASETSSLAPTEEDPEDEDYPNAWETALRERFSPEALARGVYDILGPHLSLQARKKGVQFRASFCLGVEAGDIFDVHRRQAREVHRLREEA